MSLVKLIRGNLKLHIDMIDKNKRIFLLRKIIYFVLIIGIISTLIGLILDSMPAYLSIIYLIAFTSGGFILYFLITENENRSIEKID